MLRLQARWTTLVAYELACAFCPSPSRLQAPGWFVYLANHQHFNIRTSITHQSTIVYRFSVDPRASLLKDFARWV